MRPQQRSASARTTAVMTGGGHILGAIIAGGQARRFGGDKAAAEVDGTALIERVAEALRTQCDAIVVVGRDWPGLVRIDDLPTPGLGPLGGLAGALHHARVSGFNKVLTAGCDLPDLPGDLIDRLSPAPAVIAGQPLLGLWPTTLAARLLSHVAQARDHSLRGWVTATGARTVAAAAPIANINTRDDLARYRDGR